MLFILILEWWKIDLIVTNIFSFYIITIFQFYCLFSEGFRMLPHILSYFLLPLSCEVKKKNKILSESLELTFNFISLLPSDWLTGFLWGNHSLAIYQCLNFSNCEMESYSLLFLPYCIVKGNMKLNIGVATENGAT